MKPFRYHPFDLRQLVSFAEIARTGSFRQAAKTLHVAQPALSRQIKKLEAALRVSLFDRQPHRLRLTLEARELAARLPSSFRRSTFLRKWLDLHAPDCAFPALQPRSIELASHKLSSLEVGLVLPPGHRLGTSHEIPYEKLRDEAWIFPPREANPVLYDELLGCCHRAGFSPNVIAEVTQRPRVISQVACGIGVATLAETLKHLCIGGTTYHRLVRPTPTVDLYLVYRKGDSSELLKSFVTICRELARDFNLHR